MVSEAEVREIVSNAASCLEVPAPNISFAPARVSFVPVMVTASRVIITPAARTVLSPAAVQFAVLYGMATEKASARYRGGRRTVVMLLAILVGFVASSFFKGPMHTAAYFGSATLAMVLSEVAIASALSRWPSEEPDRVVLRIVPDLDGACEYARATDGRNLNGDRPEPWANAHGPLIDLSRLERIARAMGVSTA